MEFLSRFTLIAGKDLRGSLPQEPGELEKPEMLNLSNNSLTGMIPAEVGKPSSLEELNLGYNELAGTLPTELESILLSGNELEGVLPSELGNIQSLEQQDVAYTLVHGSISTALGSLANLKSVYLTNTNLEGSIPSEGHGLDVRARQTYLVEVESQEDLITQGEEKMSVEEKVPVKEVLDASTQVEISGIERFPFLAGFQREGHLLLPLDFANTSVKWTFEDFVFEEKWEDCKVSLKGSIAIYLTDPSSWRMELAYCDQLYDEMPTGADEYYGAFMAYRDANYDSEYRLNVKGKEYCTFTLGELNSSIELEKFFSTAALQKAVNYFKKVHKNDNRFKRESASFLLRLTKQNENEEGYVILPKVKLDVDVRFYEDQQHPSESVKVKNILLLTQIFIPENCQWVVQEVDLYLEGLKRWKIYQNQKR